MCWRVWTVPRETWRYVQPPGIAECLAGLTHTQLDCLPNGQLCLHTSQYLDSDTVPGRAQPAVDFEPQLAGCLPRHHRYGERSCPETTGGGEKGARTATTEGSSCQESRGRQEKSRDGSVKRSPWDKSRKGSRGPWSDSQHFYFSLPHRIDFDNKWNCQTWIRGNYEKAC